MWKVEYKPRCLLCFSLTHEANRVYDRNRIPWLIIGICYLACASLLLVIRWLLARENARRDAESIEEEEFFIEKVLEDGTCVQVKVDKVWWRLLDLPEKY